VFVAREEIVKCHGFFLGRLDGGRVEGWGFLSSAVCASSCLHSIGHVFLIIVLLFWGGRRGREEYGTTRESVFCFEQQSDECLTWSNRDGLSSTHAHCTNTTHDPDSMRHCSSNLLPVSCFATGSIGGVAATLAHPANE